MIELNRKVEIEAAQRTIRFFESALRASADGLVITDASQKVVLVNEAFCGFLGKRMNEVRETGLDVWLEQLDTTAPSRWAELEERLHRDGLSHNAELEFLTPTGRRYFSVNASLVERIANEERGVIISIWRETTESRRAAEQLDRYRNHLERLVDEANEREQRLDRISRVLAAIRRVDQLITQEKDRRCLLDGICQLLVETHEFPGAAIVLTDERSWPPAPGRNSFFFAGVGGGVVAMAERLNAGLLPQCTTVAFEEDGPRAIGVPPDKCAGCPMATSNNQGVCIPLRHQEEVLGLLAVSVRSEHVGDPEVRSLLAEVASDIAFALWTLDNDERREFLEREYAAILTTTSDAIVAVDLKGVIKLLNPAAEQLLQCSQEDALGESFSRFCPADRLAEQTDLLRKTRQTGSIRGVESELLSADGRRIPVEMTLSLGPDDPGHPARTSVVLRDISERKRAEETLRESESRFRASFDSDAIGRTLTSPDGQLLRVNHRLSEMLGYSAEELTSLSFVNITHPDDIAASFEAVRGLLAAERDSCCFQRRLITKSGAVLWTEIHTTLLRDVQGTPMYFITGIQDISERQRAEEERIRLQARFEQAQRMESLGVLAGGIAHDFNNMLSAIMGLADLTIDVAESGSLVHQYMEQQLVAATRAAEMVQQILTFSRRSEQEKAVVSLGTIVEEAVRLLRNTLPSSISIRYEELAESPLVLASSTQVQQVIMNLCTNAHHAMWSKGGELSLSLSHCHLTAEEIARNPETREGAYALLAVSDTGAGIPPEILDRIFEPFFSTKGVGQGSGMGLAVSHGIVASHGGFMTVESQVGAGSTFHVYLPAVTGEASNDACGEGKDTTGGHARILVVDDEQVLLQLVSKMLASLGYEVTPFSTSSDALEALLLSPNAWDLVITDQTMPKMDGIEVLKTVRRLRSDLPVVIMTGHSDKLSLDADGGVGADAVLRKPFRLEVLAKLVFQVLHRPASTRRAADLE